MEKSTMFSFYFKILLLLAFTISAEDSPAKTDSADTIDKKTYKRILTSDSAKFISPPYFQLLHESSTVYEIEPLCDVSEVTLWVKTGQHNVDTLLKMTSSPFTYVWDYSGYNDLDQLNLQPGYTIITQNRDTIVSSPLTHRWVLDRNDKYSNKTYICRQISSTDSVIKLDGYLDDWHEAETGFIGGKAKFYAVWNSDKIYFAIEVNDQDVTSGDQVELMFDMKQTRSEFAGKDHRIVYFRPEGKSIVWVVSKNNGKPVMKDSIMACVSEEKYWISRKTINGYILEISFALWTLSDLGFPQKNAGFNIAIKDVDDFNKRPEVTCWSDDNKYSRNNPSEWGSMIFVQRMPLLNVSFRIMLIILALLLAVIGGLTFKRLWTERKEKKKRKDVYSRKVINILHEIDKKALDNSFTPSDAAGETGILLSRAKEIFKEETGTSIQRHITLKRIKAAKKMLKESDIPIENIALKSGFDNTNSFTGNFKDICGAAPADYRKYREQERVEEELEEGEKNE